MNLKRIMLVASMALALVAVAAPASASANWLKHHKPITQNEHIEVEGVLGFAIPGVASYRCEIDITATLFAGTTTGEIDTFDITTNKCVGEGGLQACTLKGDHTFDLPWEMHVETNEAGEPDITITDVTITNTYNDNTPNCPVHDSTVIFPAVTATPDNPTTMSTLTVSGTGAGGIQAFGTASVTPKATFGIE
ncbi:MAG TPA: hypothetical protein VNP96_07905 [Solirubrobacterales bacterium]|nr:hypothetical protein [Solirubrobacterales bacterium]